MKEFISKWSNWWILAPKRKQLDEAFEKELNELMEHCFRDKIIEFQNKLSMRIEQLAQHQSEYENESSYKNAMICSVKLRELEFVHSQLNKVLE